jgi:hypothetical protein
LILKSVPLGKPVTTSRADRRRAPGAATGIALSVVAILLVLAAGAGCDRSSTERRGSAAAVEANDRAEGDPVRQPEHVVQPLRSDVRTSRRDDCASFEITMTAARGARVLVVLRRSAELTPGQAEQVQIALRLARTGAANRDARSPATEPAFFEFGSESGIAGAIIDVPADDAVGYRFDVRECPSDTRLLSDAVEEAVEQDEARGRRSVACVTYGAVNPRRRWSPRIQLVRGPPNGLGGLLSACEGAEPVTVSWDALGPSLSELRPVWPLGDGGAIGSTVGWVVDVGAVDLGAPCDGPTEGRPR